MPRAFIALASVVGCLLLSARLSVASPFGLSASASVSSGVPLVVCGESDCHVTQASNGEFKATNSGALAQKNYVGPQLESKQSVTFVDLAPNANGAMYTSSAAGTLFTQTILDGELRAWVNSRAANDDPNTLGLTGGTANANLLWFDVVSVLSDGLAIGTPVSLLVDNHLSASLFANGAATQAFVESNTSIGSAHFANTLSFNVPGLTDSKQGLSILDQFELINTVVGATFSLQQQLSIQASSLNSGSADVNAVNTAFLNIQSLTPSVTAIGASGIDYSQVGATAVPEPATLSLLGSGLIFVRGLLWRRRRLTPPTGPL